LKLVKSNIIIFGLAKINQVNHVNQVKMAIYIVILVMIEGGGGGGGGRDNSKKNTQFVVGFNIYLFFFL